MMFKNWFEARVPEKLFASEPWKMTPEQFASYTIPPDIASNMISRIRAGDQRSKNQGEGSPEYRQEPVVYTELPISIFRPEYIQFIDETTDDERIERYAQAEIDEPIFAVVGGRSDGVIVSDGGHRLMAAIKRSQRTIPALVTLDVHPHIVAAQ